MMYREPSKRPRSELEVDLSASSGDVVAAALLDCANFESTDWAVERLLSASQDQRVEVARAAVTGFGAIARRLELPTDRRIWAALLRALDDSKLSGTAEDVIDDLELYGTVGLRSRRWRPESDD